MSAIQGYDGLERRLTSGLHLPNLSEELSKLNDLLGDDNIGAPQIRSIIANDPESTDAVLQAASNACYGTSRSVRSIEQALLYLGSRTVYTAVLASRLNSVVRSNAKARQFDPVRYRSLTSVAGVTASYVHHAASENAQNSAWPVQTTHAAATLEHFVFCLIALAEPGIYDRIISVASRHTGCPRMAFQHLYGRPFCELAGKVAESLKLQKEFVSAQRFIDTPSECPAEDLIGVSVIHIASRIIAKSGYGLLPQRVDVEVEEAAWNALGIDKMSRYELSVKIAAVAEFEAKNLNLQRTA